MRTRRFEEKLQVNKDTGRLLYDEKTNLMKREEEFDIYCASEDLIAMATVGGRTFKNEKEFCDLNDYEFLIVEYCDRVAGMLWGAVDGYYDS